MTACSARRKYRAAPAVLLATLAAMYGWPRVGVTADVEARGKDSIAAGRDVVIEKNVVVQEYDKEKARKIEASRFARTMYRSCQDYLTVVGTIDLTAASDHAMTTQPGIFSPVYSMPDTHRTLGDGIYKNLNSQQQKLKSLQDQLFSMRLQYRVASTYAMMAQYNPRAEKKKKETTAAPAPTAEDFSVKKDELASQTAMHCQYLKSLI